jgi:hypothetical protein
MASSIHPAALEAFRTRRLGLAVSYVILTLSPLLVLTSTRKHPTHRIYDN